MGQERYNNQLLDRWKHLSPAAAEMFPASLGSVCIAQKRAFVHLAGVGYAAVAGRGRAAVTALG